MFEEKSIIELVSSLENSFQEILSIIKAIGNNKRLKILLTLLTGEKTFENLKKETKLQKTALANHLIKLMKILLIEKPDYGKYKITSDGELFIRAMENAYKYSDIRESKGMEVIQRGQFSKDFVDSFFGSS